jgi:hypothetical protein
MLRVRHVMGPDAGEGNFTMEEVPTKVDALPIETLLQRARGGNDRARLDLIVWLVAEVARLEARIVVLEGDAK